MATLARILISAPNVFIQRCQFGALGHRHLSRVPHVLPRQSPFEDILSDENKQRVQERMKYEIPVVTEKINPLKPDHGVASVLVPLCTVDGEPSIMMTVRSRKLPKYRGQISFPGGNVDASDPSLEFTALRETHEEVGLEPSAFDIWGQMNPIPAARDGRGKLVYPILARTGEVDVSKLGLSDEEVEEIFTVSIKHLCRPESSGVTRFRPVKNNNGLPSYTLPVYVSAPHRVWGLTSIIIHMTLNLLVPDVYTFKVRHTPDVC